MERQRKRLAMQKRRQQAAKRLVERLERLSGGEIKKPLRIHVPGGPALVVGKAQQNARRKRRRKPLRRVTKVMRFITSVTRQMIAPLRRS